MKKLFTRSLALVMCAAICISLAACGKKAASVEEYINNNQKLIDQMVESQQVSGMTLTLTADGDTLIYRYQFETDLGMDNTTAAAQLEPGVDALESDMLDVLKALKGDVPSAEAIRVEFLDRDGNVIISKDFS